jgi:putative sporulation protein YtaF
MDMASFGSLLLLAFAVSLDSFSVGFTYGLRKMRIPIKSILIIACCSGLILLFSMAAGHFLTGILPEETTEKFGGILLILMGSWVLYQFFRPEKEQDFLIQEKTVMNLEMKSLGIVIQILRKPASADIDRSGTINGVESFLLGFALSIDAFGAGIGASMLGFSPVDMSLSVAVMSSSFLLAGMKTGYAFSRWSWLDKLACLPGLLLIAIGIWKL